MKWLFALQKPVFCCAYRRLGAIVSRNRVFITGIGMLTSLGKGLGENWVSLLEQKNGAVSIDRLPPLLAGKGVHVAAPVTFFNLEEWGVSGKLIRSMSKHSAMLVFSGLQALKDAGLEPEEIRKLDIGAIIGTGCNAMDEYPEAPAERNPRWFFDTYPNIHLGYLSIVAGLTGFGSTIVNACTSGTQAIGLAMQRIREGHADIMLAGGVDSKLTPSSLSGFARLNMHTTSKDPEHAMRPFDADRSGFVISEGSGVLVLESEEHAKRRRADIYAEVAGFGSSMDAISLTDASAEGKRKAMANALQDGQAVPCDVDYINTHGTSTRSNDAEESTAIKQLFPDYSRILINSTKSMMGHSLAASGAIEAGIVAQSLRTGLVHATLNFQRPCNKTQGLRIVHNQPHEQKIACCLSSSSGIGGFNSSLLFKKFLR